MQGIYYSNIETELKRTKKILNNENNYNAIKKVLRIHKKFCVYPLHTLFNDIYNK